MHRASALLVALALAACSGTGTTTSEAPASTGGTTGGGDSSSGSVDACEDSKDCDTEGLCVAPYVVEEDSYGGERGPAACVPDCIEPWDLSRWCFDHSACCGTDRCKSVDGVCEPLDPDTTGSTTTETTTTDGGTGSTTTSSSTTSMTTSSGTGDSTIDPSTGSSSTG